MEGGEGRRRTHEPVPAQRGEPSDGPAVPSSWPTPGAAGSGAERKAGCLSRARHPLPARKVEGPGAAVRPILVGTGLAAGMRGGVRQPERHQARVRLAADGSRNPAGAGPPGKRPSWGGTWDDHLRRPRAAPPAPSLAAIRVPGGPLTTRPPAPRRPGRRRPRRRQPLTASGPLPGSSPALDAISSPSRSTPSPLSGATRVALGRGRRDVLGCAREVAVSDGPVRRRGHRPRRRVRTATQPGGDGPAGRSTGLTRGHRAHRLAACVTATALPTAPVSRTTRPPRPTLTGPVIVRG